MEYTLDVINQEGIPFRVKLDPSGGHYSDEPIVEFYDRRYTNNRDGQFTGARYYTASLLESHLNNEGYGLNLNGAVQEWHMDKGSMIIVLGWIESFLGRVI